MFGWDERRTQEKYRFPYGGNRFVTIGKADLFRFVGQQDGGMGFQGNCQLQEGGKGNIDHSLFDLGDLAVVDATGIRHLAKTKTFLLAELSKVLTEPFQYLFVCWRNHICACDESPRWSIF